MNRTYLRLALVRSPGDTGEARRTEAWTCPRYCERRRIAYKKPMCERFKVAARVTARSRRRRSCGLPDAGASAKKPAMEILALLTDPAAWAALLTLCCSRWCSGSTTSSSSPSFRTSCRRSSSSAARRIGLFLALVMRIAPADADRLAGDLAARRCSTSASAARPAPHGEPTFETAFSGRDLILLAGGLFLLWKATKEIHHNMDPADPFGRSARPATRGRPQIAFGAAIAQIIALDLVFSIDSILTAVGMTDDVPIMVAAVVITVGIMLFAADPLARVHRAQPDAGHARARVPGDDRAGADRRRLRLPCAQGLHLRGDGLLGRGRAAQHGPAQPARASWPGRARSRQHERLPRK